MTYAKHREFTALNDAMVKNYIEKVSIDHCSFPVSRPLDHTMDMDIDEWAKGKIPFHILRDCIKEGVKIEVHGIYPDFFPLFNKHLGIADVQKIRFGYNTSKKLYNYVRPHFFWCKRSFDTKTFLVIAVIPGRDYVLQYASLLRHNLSLLTRDYENYFTIYRYPHLEDAIADWSGLHNGFIKPKDLVVLGFVEELQEYFIRNKGFSKFAKIGDFENSFYRSRRYRVKNSVVNFLTVKFSFWGCISGKIAQCICQLGAREIIYIGKLGALRSIEDVYSRIFSPTQYYIADYTNTLPPIKVVNPFVSYFPHLDSRAHVSVPTVVEQDYKQRTCIEDLHAHSIDNEISQIALAVHEFNEKNNSEMCFSSIDFATDYLRKIDEKNLLNPFYLINKRSFQAKEKKRMMLQEIGTHFFAYLDKAVA